MAAIDGTYEFSYVYSSTVWQSSSLGSEVVCSLTYHSTCIRQTKLLEGSRRDKGNGLLYNCNLNAKLRLHLLLQCGTIRVINPRRIVCGGWKEDAGRGVRFY